MNKIIKFFVYTILLILHMFGATAATLLGLAFLAMTITGILNSSVEFIVGGLIGALISLGLQRFFISLDPSYMYQEDDW